MLAGSLVSSFRLLINTEGCGEGLGSHPGLPGLWTGCLISECVNWDFMDCLFTAGAEAPKFL